MFELIRPAPVTLASLISSNVAETISLWAGGATYAEDNLVRADLASGSRVYQSLQAGNIGNALTETDWWADMGPTNRWRALDGSPTSQTQNADSIVYEFEITGYADRVVVLNCDAASIRVEQTVAGVGVVFDQTVSLVSPSGILNFWDWLFEPIERVTKKVVSGLRPYANSTVKVTLSALGGTAKVGQVTVGLSKALGGMQWGATFGVQDYSRKGKDDFGYAKVVERAYADVAGFTVWVDDGFVDQLGVLLARYRATPIVWVGDARYASTVVFGWPSDWRCELREAGKSLLSIDLEGLA